MAALRLATAAAVVFPLVVHLLVAPSRGHGPALMPLATVGAAALITPLSTPGDLPPGMARDEQIAVAVVDGFWKRHFAEYFGRKYHSPLVVGDYLGGRGPSCDGRRPLSMNAFYCKPQDFLAWDPRLMAAGYGKIGRAWVYLIIAHEWGHTIQARVNRRLVSVASELQADCLAGAELAGAQRDGPAGR